MNEDSRPIIFSQLRQGSGDDWTANILLCGFRLPDDFLDHVRSDPWGVTAEEVGEGLAVMLTATFAQMSAAYDFFDAYFDLASAADPRCEKWGATYYGAAYGGEPRGPEQFRARYPMLVTLVWDDTSPREPYVVPTGHHASSPWWSWVQRQIGWSTGFLGRWKRNF